MNRFKLLRRFLVFPVFVSLYCYLRFRAKVSPRAEVELSSTLKLGSGTTISSFTKLKSSDGPLRIGRNVSIATGCFIAAAGEGVVIGDDSLIGPGVTIVSSSYRFERIDIPFREQGTESKLTRVGRNVFVGAGARILAGADVGDGAMISANSVVSTSIPKNAIAQGSPAQVVFIRR